MLLGDEIVAEQPRHFRRDQIIYDPWHYLPVLVKKPGALRNGAPFKNWDLPPALAQVRAKLKSHADGGREKGVTVESELTKWPSVAESVIHSSLPL